VQFRQCSKEDLVRDSGAEPAVRPTCVKELEVAAQASPHFRDCPVRVEVDGFVFDRALEAF
jgi:hypothetical protein